MFLQFLISTVFCLGVVIIPMQVFSDNNPNTEEVIIVQEEDEKLTKEAYIRKTLKETYNVFREALLESSWLQSDSGMSDEFIAAVIFNNIGLPILTQILRSSDTVDMDELSLSIKPSIENLSKEQITSLILKDQEKSIAFIFKTENESGGPSSYSVLTIDRNSFAKNTPQMLETIKKIIEENHITEIGVNIFQDFEPNAAIALSKYFKEKEINIHVVGFCNGNCANYLLLDAKSISIGPYGLISYDGLISNIYNEALQIISQNNKKSQEASPSSLENDEELEIFLIKFYNSSEKRKELEDSIFDRENYRYLFSKIDTFLHKNLEIESMNEFAATRVVLFLSESEKELLHGLSKSLKNARQETIDTLSSYAMAENEFIKSRSPIESTLSYSIFDLFNLIHDISRSSFIEALYPDYQRKYQSQEVSQPLYIVPSESLLKNLGVNIIKGANYSSKRMEKDENQNLIFFDLNESQIEKCGFFKEDTNSSHAKQCLMNLLKNN